jgi:hypothetical protein
LLRGGNTLVQILLGGGKWRDCSGASFLTPKSFTPAHTSALLRSQRNQARDQSLQHGALLRG